MKEQRKSKYKPVKEVEGILSQKKKPKEILFDIWDWKKNLKAQPGSVIATGMSDKFEVENFGEENNLRNFNPYHEKYFREKYTLLYKRFSQVEEVERYKNYLEKQIKTYVGLHRTDCIDTIKVFCEDFAQLPESTNDEIFLKKYGSLKQIGFDQKLKSLEKELNKNIQAFEIWQKQTKLPDRYYLGEIQIKSLREFEKAKSNLNYITLQGKTIAIESIEHWEGITGECHHGLGKLKSVDRAVYVNGKRISIKRFDKGFLLDVLIPILKPKKISIETELKSVQLENHFAVQVVTIQEDKTFYSRNIFGLVWDYCVVDKDGVTFHADSIDELLPGLQKKIDAINESKKIKEIVSSGKDELISLSKLDKKDYKGFVDRFKIRAHVKNKKILRSILTEAINSNLLADRHSYLSSYWLSAVPLLDELRKEFYANFEKKQKEENARKEKIVLSEKWSIEKARSKFGFCAEGMKAFCRANKINSQSELTGAQILDKVKKNLERNSPFKYELRVLFPASLGENK
ncbi:MAG: hypothetical protein KBA66_21850 [Leptospiraceae bacterium]|nr:hypothetical protein [Leptospiraceae bacterium]